MSTRYFQQLLSPQSVAIFGASDRPGSVGHAIMQNVLAGGFRGPVLPVNPKYAAVGGVLAYRNVDELPLCPDLAILCTPPLTIPNMVSELGRRGVRAAVVITAGLDRCKDAHAGNLQQALLDAARRYSVRVLGPNCVGLISSSVGLNASFVRTQPLSGNLAFITQSGALASAAIDWASSSQIGFSHFISLGNAADIDFGDLLSYLADDSNTAGILLYLEGVDRGAKFLKAAQRAAARKPIVAVKAGRVAAGARAAASHTGAMAGSDRVYDAAFQRAGIVRVASMEALFNAMELMARPRPFRGNRLAILTNGGGFGVMAVDALVRYGGRPANLSSATIQKLDASLPANWSRSNPVDIIGDASLERYVTALNALLGDDDVDAVLILHAPTALTSSDDIAKAVVPIIQRTDRSVLTCWLGRHGVETARREFASRGIPCFSTPEDAVEAFVQLTSREQQRIELAKPTTRQPPKTADVTRAREIVKRAILEQRSWLEAIEVASLLRCYGLKTVESKIAADEQEACVLAERMGFPVALKVVSADIVHKSDIGGVALNLGSARELAAAAADMRQRLASTRPNAKLSGFLVQEMLRRPSGEELIVGITRDPTFGPVVLFGKGGIATEVVADTAVALPPLDRRQVECLIRQTHVSKLLAGYRDRPAVNFESLIDVIIQVSQMAVDLPEIAELDINPVVADAKEAIAIDARVRVAAPSEPSSSTHPQLACSETRCPAGLDARG